MNITSANVHSSIYDVMSRSTSNTGNFESLGKKTIKTVVNSENENKKKNLFGFASVSITEAVVKEKYGDAIIKGARIRNQTAGSKTEADYVKTDPEKVSAIELPASFNSLKDSYSYYYHGNKVSDYELIQTAVASGKMEFPSEKCSGSASHQAFKVLVQDEAAKKNEWSDTLYSEDGHYTFTLTGDGKYQMHLLDDEGVGASLEDISNWIMSGIPNRNIETRYLNYLRTVDPDLCNVAMRIGSEVRTNDIMDDLYEKGLISENQNQYDMGLLGMMFGKNADDMRCLINNCRSTGNFLELLDLYQPEGDESLLNLRLKQSEETNGNIF